ncbi:MAG: hypothetical protein GY765_31495 [bacterium]|nr:hypothetical protein [bacterium]
MASNMRLIVIVVSIIILIVTLAVTVFLVARKRKRQAEQDGQQGKGADTIPRGASGEDSFEGTFYSYKHFRGTDKAPPYFQITIPCSSDGTFTITPETAFDRFFKKFGICLEMETHDKTFDDKFFIHTDKIPFTRSFLEKSANRRSIRELFELGFNNLKHDGNVLTVTWQKFPRRQLMEKAVINRAVAFLAALGPELTKTHTYETEDTSNWKMKRLVAFVLPGLLLVSGLVTMILGLISFKPLDGGRMFASSLLYGLPLFVVFVWFAIGLLKGRSSSHKELVAVFFIALFAFPLAGFGYKVFLNGKLDNEPATVHEARVVNKYYSRNKSSYTYYGVVESWRENVATEKIKISKHLFNKLDPGESVLTITTKPGKFNFEWLVNYCYITKP